MSRLLTVIAILVVVASCGGGDGGPSFAKDHPRVYVQAEKDRLTAALGTPAGMRFKTAVDKWVGGADIYAFPAWYAALVGQLTGDAKYCTAAIAAVDKQVSAAESAIGGGRAPRGAGGDKPPSG